jgi:A/G-specific adenine glycosylase
MTWFRAARRELPWRQSRDPYRVWVSEVMLQQTTVAAVVPYFHRFLERFPTLEALAAADEQAVLRAWEGLGYYRRARSLHQAARRLVAEFGGELPRDAALLQGLPGFGRYTVGAVLSQAFDMRLPIVEANSARVLARFFACRRPLGDKHVQAWLWRTAEALLPRRGTGEFNQALMELGALVCTPTKPACLLCPVASYCQARAAGEQELIPVKAKPPPVTAVAEVALILERRARVLLLRRPPDATRWANLWEFPHGPVSPGESPVAAARRVAAELTGLVVGEPEPIGTVRHGVTRFRITMECFRAAAAGRVHRTFHDTSAWLRPEELAKHPLSVPQRRLASLLTAHE